MLGVGDEDEGVGLVGTQSLQAVTLALPFAWGGFCLKGGSTVPPASSKQLSQRPLEQLLGTLNPGPPSSPEMLGFWFEEGAVKFTSHGQLFHRLMKSL